jgi:hypothetical protein
MYIDSGETAYMGEPHCAHFWVALTSNIQRAAAFMAKMIEKVAKYLEDPKKAIKRKSKDGIENLRRHMFYLKNTITLLGLYFDMHGTSAELQAAVERISKMTHIHMLDAEDQNLYAAMQQAVNFVRKPVTRSVASLVINVTMFENKGTLTSMPGVEGVTFPTSPRLLQASAFKDFHMFFPSMKVHLMREPSTVLGQLRKLISSLQWIGSQAGARLQMQALLGVVRECLTIRPTTNIGWLTGMSQLVTSVLKWPLPTSSIAKDLLDFLQNEIASPGHALRRLVHGECGQLDPRTPRLEHQKVVGNVNFKKIPCYPVIVDASSPLSRMTAALISSSANKQVSEILATTHSWQLPVTADHAYNAVWDGEGLGDDGEHPLTENDIIAQNMRRVILIHILSCDFDLSRADLEDPLGLHSVDPPSVSEYYAEALTICDKALALGRTENAARCKQYRETHLSALLRRIDATRIYPATRCEECFGAPRGAEVAEASVPELSLLPPPPVEHRPVEHAGPENVFTPPLPSTHFSFITLPEASHNLGGSLSRGIASASEVEERVTTHTNATHRGLVYDPTADQQLQAMLSLKVKDLRDTAAKMGKNIGDITSWTYVGRAMASKEWALPTSSSVVYANDSGDGLPGSVLKIAVMGSNKALHRLLCVLHNQNRREPTTFQNFMDLHIYLLPDGRNDLANYIAWFDGMYERHVYKSFVSPPPFLPSYSIDINSFERVKGHKLGEALPSLLQRDALEQYMRFASQLYPVVTWQCQCWDGMDGSDAIPVSPSALGATAGDATCNVIIPFAISVDIGVLCDAELYRHKHPEVRDCQLNVSSIGWFTLIVHADV